MKGHLDKHPLISANWNDPDYAKKSFVDLRDAFSTEQKFHEARKLELTGMNKAEIAKASPVQKMKLQNRPFVGW